MRLKKNGFTLVELLVVVAIMVILIAILLPSLEAAFTHANTTTCAAQEHAIGVAMYGYAGDSLSVFPKGWGPSIGIIAAAARDGLEKYLGGTGTLFYGCPTPIPPFWGYTIESWNARAPHAGLGYWYLANPKDGISPPDTYWLDTDNDGFKNDEYMEKMTATDGSPADIAIVADLNEGTADYSPKTLSVRHSSSGVDGNNMLYGDGHAAFKPRDKFISRWSTRYGW